MADIKLVETSLRDGNQCLWAALGVDTARTLSIAPVLDRAGYKAIDFTTSTHMGVAVRYKQEDPWERIRLTAEAMPNTPLQFLSTGFRFIAWETASPEFMALAYRTLVNNGIRRFALREHGLMLHVSRDGPSNPGLGEKAARIEFWLSGPHRKDSVILGGLWIQRPIWTRCPIVKQPQLGKRRTTSRNTWRFSSCGLFEQICSAWTLRLR